MEVLKTQGILLRFSFHSGGSPRPFPFRETRRRHDSVPGIWLLRILLRVPDPQFVRVAVCDHTLEKPTSAN
jgi:hypothetical protein